MRPSLLAIVLLSAAPADRARLLSAAPAERPRLLVLTDIGGDPDDTQSMIRLMLYSNELELEALIASAAGTPGELNEQVTRPELIRGVVEAYGQVRPSLLRHDERYPPAEELLAKIHAGNPRRGVGSLGAEHDTAGSQAIIAAADRDDPRPLNIAIWGGSTELAQALWRVRNDRGAEGAAEFCRKLRVHDIAHQDDTGPWIVREFPVLFYVLNRWPDRADRREAVFRGMYLGGDMELTSRAWIDAHVREGHGPLGALFPTRTWTDPNPHGCLKEGDTPSWFYFLANGLHDPDHPDWGGWGGRFQHVRDGLWRDAADTVGDETHPRATVHRWRTAFQAEYAARMDWCVKPPEQANHAPVAVIDGDETRAVLHRPINGTITLDAGGSHDPDGDALSFRWWQYREPGSYQGEVTLTGTDTPRVTVALPAGAAGSVHLVLEVTDGGAPALTAYRRVVLVIPREWPPD